MVFDPRLDTLLFESGCGPTKIKSAVQLYVHGYIELEELECMIEVRLRWDDVPSSSPLRPFCDALTQVCK